MKRPTVMVCAAVVCALLGLQASGGSASAHVRGEPVAVAPAGGAAGGVTELPQVSDVAPESADAADGGARVATVRAVAGRGPRHDYNRDGRSDMVSWYDYSDGSDAMHTFAAGPDGGLSAPLKAWETTEGNYWAEHMKYVTGDFNGDGTGDVAAFYGYDDGKVSLFTWLGKGDGRFGTRLTSWTADPGNWTFDAITAEAGDFDGDGRDDIAAWYDYSNGDDKLFTFLARTDGGFGSPFSSFARTAADGWEVGRMKFATGDYDGDGRDDLGVLYGYASGTVTLMSFTGGPGGGFAEPVRGWESTTGWTFSRATVHSGDFDGDGRDSIAAWYDYADGHDALIGFDLDTEGRFGHRRELLNRPAGWYERSRMKIVTGDYNGDGRDDLATVYGYTDLRSGTVKTITFTAQSDGTLAGDLHGWETETGWTFDRMRPIERHSEGLPVCPTIFGHGGYPTGANAWERDQVRQPNHPTGLAQQKSWGAAGVEADLQLTKDGTKGVMWHNTSTRGLTGPNADANAIWWATGADQLKGRTIDQGPYKGETVYTFREWLDSAKSQNMAALVELKGEAGQSLLNNDASIRETAWNEVIAPIKERIASQQIMIYTGSDNVGLKAELEKRIEAAGLGATLRNHPRWVDGIGWEEPAPAASGNYATWLNRLNRYGLPTTSVPMATTWPKELKSWLSGRCV
ncbi:FG-GAP-like repeat-containing protein [Streptomyces sp. NBC_01335]|uniref:FG-GAP-like repeat-containing protein n=1 Tax=Streptomyces sp. NBC_01335 TaxID=2903828 RepID=UPI002E0D8879|nr:FG-GAP-like repeat-containing protein [Streptomyces sp. NBC_01335]